MRPPGAPGGARRGSEEGSRQSHKSWAARHWEAGPELLTNIGPQREEYHGLSQVVLKGPVLESSRNVLAPC